MSATLEAQSKLDHFMCGKGALMLHIKSGLSIKKATAVWLIISVFVSELLMLSMISLFPLKLISKKKFVPKCASIPVLFRNNDFPKSIA